MANKRLDEADMPIIVSYSENQHYDSQEQMDKLIIDWMESIYLKYSNSIIDD